MNIILRSTSQLSYAMQTLRKLELSNGKNPWVVSFARKKTKRSTQQNNLFHLWCTQIAQQSGSYSMEQVKKSMKKAYGVWKIVEVYSEKQIDMKSTAEYTAKEMTKLMEGVQEFAANHGCELTNPLDLGIEI